MVSDFDICLTFLYIQIIISVSKNEEIRTGEVQE